MVDKKNIREIKRDSHIYMVNEKYTRDKKRFSYGGWKYKRDKKRFSNGG